MSPRLKYPWRSGGDAAASTSGSVGALAQDVAHLAEVVRDEVDGARPEARTGDVGEEVRDVAQPVAELAVEVGPVVQCVHLVHADAVRAVGRGLDRVEQRDRLAVGERHDDVGARADVLEDSIRIGGLPHHRVNVGGRRRADRTLTDRVEPGPFRA